MEKQIITFSANEQNLQKTSGLDKYSSNKVSYIEAHFDPGENWSGFDSVRAVWFSDFACISTVLNSLGECVVPYEVLKRRSKVKVNLVGSIAEDDVLTDRLTSYPILALTVDADAMVCGDNTQPITPTEYEQFVASVKNDADRAEAGATSAEASADAAEISAQNALTSEQNAKESEDNAKESEENAKVSEQNAYNSEVSAGNSASEAESWADKAEQAASDAGYMFFYIDDNGHLIMEHTSNVDSVDFSLINGHLILEVA